MDLKCFAIVNLDFSRGHYHSARRTLIPVTSALYDFDSRIRIVPTLPKTANISGTCPPLPTGTCLSKKIGLRHLRHLRHLRPLTPLRHLAVSETPKTKSSSLDMYEYQGCVKGGLPVSLISQFQGTQIPISQFHRTQIQISKIL